MNKYLVGSLKAYAPMLIMMAAANVAFVYFGMADIALWVSSIVAAFVAGTETAIGQLRVYCRKHKIDPDTFKPIEEKKDGQ